MSGWAGKYVIGLTGNIGTGKSVVRRMLERLGAYGIDADALTHRVISREGPGYRAVVETFGRWVLTPEQEIDRARLGRLVFSDPEALRLLENIVHPLVSEAVDLLVRHASQTVIVIEAIKLLESQLRANCDSIWVVHVPREVQLERLMRDRKMSAEEAAQRIDTQPPQEEKLRAADVVIENDGTLEETWARVEDAWRARVPRQPGSEQTPPSAPEDLEALKVVRGRPSNAADIAALLNRRLPQGAPADREDILAAFGEKAFHLAYAGERPVGVLGWQVENLVTRVIDIAVEAEGSGGQVLPALVEAVEGASRELQSEASLVLLSPGLEQAEEVFRQHGYKARAVEELETEPWQAAARGMLSGSPEGTRLLFKKLRAETVVRPI